MSDDPIGDYEAKSDAEWKVLALHHAADKGYVVEIPALVDEGYALDAIDDLGNTPLHNAVWKNRFEAAVLLLERGAVPTLRFGLRRSALDKVRGRKQEDWPAKVALIAEWIHDPAAFRLAASRKKNSLK